MTDFSADNSYQEPEITPCPSTLDSPELQDDNKWVSYGSGTSIFHCGFEGFNENKEAIPESPRQQCFYDEDGNLVDKDHEYAGCQGSPDQHSNWFDHSFDDSGGIFSQAGWDGLVTSVEYYYDSAKDYVADAYDSVEDYVADAYDSAKDYVADAYDSVEDY